MTREASVGLEELAKLCSRWPTSRRGQHAATVVRRLGAPLARVWAKPDVIAAAEAYHRELYGLPAQPLVAVPAGVTTARGRCQLLLVTKGYRDLPLLRPAFILPVEWRRVAEAGESSPRLPGGLAEFATTVLADVTVDGLSLHLPVEYEEAGVDLSALQFGHESAWAALAAGAMIFNEQGAMLRDIMATARWSAERSGRTSGWVMPVEGVVEKLTAATAAGARLVFVSRENRADVERWRALGGDGPEIRELSSQIKPSPAAAIADLLEAIELPPTRAADDSFDRRRDYHLRMPATMADDYYREELLADVCDRLRGRLPSDPRLAEVRRLVFIASQSLSVPYLLTSLFNPNHILVLHDGAIGEPTLARCLRDLATLGRAAGEPPRGVQTSSCDPENLEAAVAARVAGFEETCPQGRLLVDLTPGYRAFNLALLAAAPAAAVTAFVHSPQSGKQPGRSRAGAEELRIFRQRH